MPEQMTPAEKLSNDQRRALVLAALVEGGNKSKLAAGAGISRRWLHMLIEEAKEDPEGKFEEAVKEVRFRRQVRDLLSKKSQSGGHEK